MKYLLLIIVVKYYLYYMLPNFLIKISIKVLIYLQILKYRDSSRQNFKVYKIIIAPCCFAMMPVHTSVPKASTLFHIFPCSTCMYFQEAKLYQLFLFDSGYKPQRYLLQCYFNFPIFIFCYFKGISVNRSKSVLEKEVTLWTHLKLYHKQ